MTGEPLSALRTPLGAIEVSGLVAGVEAAVAGWLGFALILAVWLLPFIGSASWSTWRVSVIAGVAATLIFACVFIGAQRGYNVAITDAGKIGPP